MCQSATCHIFLGLRQLLLNQPAVFGMPTLSPQTNLYYCGERKDLKGTDGFCGPNNGPQCEDCNRYQATFFPGSFPNVMLDSSRLPAVTQYTSNSSSYEATPPVSAPPVSGNPGDVFKGICSKCGGHVLATQERGKDPVTGQYYHMKCPSIEQAMDSLQVGDEPLYVHMQKLQGEVQTADGKPKKSFITGQYYCGQPTNFTNLKIPGWDGNCGPGDEASFDAPRVPCVSCDAYAKSLAKKVPTYIAKPKDEGLMAYLDCLFTVRFLQPPNRSVPTDFLLLEECKI